MLTLKSKLTLKTMTASVS